MSKHFLFLTFEFPPAYGGGLSTYMHHACKALVDAGNQVTVICPDGGVSTGRRVKIYHGAKVVHFNPYRHAVFKYMGHWPAMSYAISDELKWAVEHIGRPDVVESCDGFALPYYSMLRKATLEAPFDKLSFILTAHTPCSLIDKWNGKNMYELPTYWQSVMERWCFKAADLVQAPSSFLIRKLREEFDIERDDMEVVRNPYAADPSLKVSKALSTADRPYFCVASRVAHWKGVPQIIAEMNVYWASGGEVALHICGQDTEDPNTGRSLTQMLSEKYEDRIRSGRLCFLGNQSGEKLAEIRRGSIAQIHPSLNENYPYTVLEAMAQGTPVVVNHNGGQAEIVDNGEDGIVFDLEDGTSVQKALRTAESLTQKQRQSIIEKAKAKVEGVSGYTQFAAKKIETVARISDLSERKLFPFVFGSEKKFKALSDAHNGKESKPRLTVVIPYYNMHEFIDETVDSVAVSSEPVEIIIVDDGSTYEGTQQKLAEIQEKYSNVRVLRKKNGGVAETRNVGVEAATTEFVALLDADDLVEPGYYREALRIMERYANVAFVGCWANDFDENGTIRYWPTFSPEPPLQYLMNMTNCQAIILRREAFLAAGRHDPNLKMYLDDWEAVTSLVANGYRGVMIPHPLFNYRIRKDSIFRSEGDRWQKNYQYILNKHAEYLETVSLEMVSLLNANGPNTCYHNPTYPSAYRGGEATFDELAHNGRLYRIVKGYYNLMYRGDGPRSLHLIRGFLDKPFNLAFAAAVRARRAFRA